MIEKDCFGIGSKIVNSCKLVRWSKNEKREREREGERGRERERERERRRKLNKTKKKKVKKERKKERKKDVSLHLIFKGKVTNFIIFISRYFI